MSDVVVELLICAMSDVGEKQKNAEAVIYKTRDENLAVFLQELIRVARTETADMRARQMALLLLKNTVAFNAREEAAKKELEDRWKSITPEMRKEVRGEVLATLGSSQREVRTTASNVVANLARIELPHNDWPDLLPSLFQAAQCDGTMEASITTLGYICEETNTCAPLENVLLQYSNDILSCVIRGMQHSDAEVIYQSTNALCNAVTFIHKNMESKEERDYIMSTVCSKCINHEARTMTRAMECLCRIAAEYYSKLVDYMHAIFSITTQALMSNNDDGVMQGFQFWSTICEVEAELLEMDEDLPDQSSPQPTASSEYQKYAQGAAQHILPITLSFLLKQEEFQTEEDWNVSTAAGVCLQRFASVLRNDIGAYVMPFVNDNVSQQNWRNCEAGIMAFACILEGPSSEVLEEVILNSIKALFYYCQNNQHSLVRDTSVWALARIANFHPQIILSRPPLLDEILLVAEKLIGDTPVLANKACSILHNLCLEVEEMFDDEACSTNCMSKYFQRFVRILLQTVDRNDAHEGNLRAAAQETLNSLLGCVAPDVLGEVSSLVPELVSRINKSFSFCGPNVSASMLEEIQLMQGLLCGALQHVIQKLADSISNEQANLIMSAFQSVLQSSQNVHEEALMAVGALASSQGKKFSQYLESLTPHFLSGLRSKNDAKLMNITVGVVGDIYAAIGQLAPEPFTDQIMLILLENIRDEEIWRDCRPSILSAFGDIALHIAENFAKYLPVVMSVLDSADKIANQVDPNDEDLVTFSIDLREAICDAYTGMLQGLKNHPTLVLPAMDSILSFIARNGTNSSDEKLLECCVNVAGDVLNVFSSREARNMYPPIEKFVQDSGIQGMVQRAQSSRNKTLVKAAEWTMKQAQCFFSCK